MKVLVIRNLYLFDLSNKTAKRIDFTSGINVITSSKENGNKKGKSLILKSIYYTFGADCYFEDMWSESNKASIIYFSINNINYYIYRSDRLFKVFSDDFVLKFKTIHRRELASNLKRILDFAVELPNRAGNELEIAAPAFNYLLNFIDQDKMDCTSFTSFKGLAEYPNFKENTLYYHFGVFTDEYYMIIKDLERYEQLLKGIDNERLIIIDLLQRITKQMGGSDFSSNLNSLKLEIDKFKNEYNDIAKVLSKMKHNIIHLKNQRTDLEINLKDLKNTQKNLSDEINQINKSICPTCKKHIDNNIPLRVNKYNSLEDIVLLELSAQQDISSVEDAIDAEEKKYEQFLDKLNNYQNRINITYNDIDNVMEHLGLVRIKDQLMDDLGVYNTKKEAYESDIKRLNKEKHKFDEKKKKVNNSYYELMYNDKTKFGLVEIENRKIESIDRVFTASGSNKAISTIIWYFNLLRLRYTFNSSGTKLPLVIDSPNKGDLDDDNRRKVFDYLFSNVDNQTQLIISTLGFEKADYPRARIDNIVELENEKYHLLNSDDFSKHYELLMKFT